MRRYEAWYFVLIYLVRVDGDGVDVIGVSIGEYPPRTCLYHQLHGLEDRNSQACDGGRISEDAAVFL